ncbi:TIGR03086 family metal-binding protein [Streptomyces sp. LP11]|uniref:TIGR03086 family metal-binding protein n=1 Tax=Streptomyces pyxinicus TaxID=2970331 RepID=A0ABT2B3Y6_9ACTN|nr:TIGR03086 family metal-binding protein [Streptomyces sp. LP11]MCS0603238.1 TIGR03086 family metal-binding protein [Streptomyces sp. LP11]
MTMVDLGPQTEIVARLAAAVTDERLTDATPCPDLAVSDLLGHLHMLSVAFRDAARKNLGATTDTSPDSNPAGLAPGWRAELPEALAELAEAWRDPAAWTGDTRAGGVDLPGAVAGTVVADELVIHGWDLARATGQDYTPDPAALALTHTFLRTAADLPDAGDGLFGPPVPVPPTASPLDRAVGLSGRDPGWRR